MTASDIKSRSTTRHLEMPPVLETPPTVQKPIQTGPLDRSLPWVIEFRIVGTATTLQTQVREAMIIGRGDVNSGFSPDVDLTPFDAYSKGVSRRHAVIIVKDNRLYLRDLNSTNGSRANTTICEAGQEIRLRHGDELQFGHLHLQMTFTVVPTATADQTNEVSAVKVERAPVKGGGRRVLIVENDPHVGSVFQLALEEVGFRATVVNDVTKGLGYVFQSMPDAIVLDMMLPDMNGLDLVRYVRKQKTPSRIPVLVIGSSNGNYQVNQAVEAGADMILNKPVAVNELLSAVGNFV